MRRVHSVSDLIMVEQSALVPLVPRRFSLFVAVAILRVALRRKLRRERGDPPPLPQVLAYVDDVAVLIDRADLLRFCDRSALPYWFAGEDF